MAQAQDNIKYSAAELQKKYAGSGYKSTTAKEMSNSSFWLDDDSFTENVTQVNTVYGRYGKVRREKSLDLVKLSAYQRAISNFVRILTKRDDIKVVYSSGKDSYTDGSRVVISAKLDKNEFDSSVGLALHEASHVALTNFNVIRELTCSYNSYVMRNICDWHTINKIPYDYLALLRIKGLINVIEDRRIDQYVYDNAPGYQGYYTALYDKYFNAKEIDAALRLGMKNDPTKFEDYDFHITNFANPNRNLKVLPVLQKVWDMIDIPNISRLTDTTAVRNLAIEVYKVIILATHEAFKAAEAAKALEDEPKKEAPKEQAPKKESEPKEDIDEDDEDESDNGDEFNDNLDIPDSMPGDSSESEESDEEGSDTSTGSGNDDSEDSDSEEAGEGSGTSEDSEEAGEEMSEAEKAARQKEIEKVAKKLDKIIEDQKKFGEGNINKRSLSKEDAAKTSAIAETNSEFKSVGDGEHTTESFGIGKTSCLVVRGISDLILESNLLRSQGRSGHNLDYFKKQLANGKAKDFVADGITLGKLLGKKLQTRDEERSIKTTRLDSGRIDKRLIAELGFGNDKVFAQTYSSSVSPAFIHISVDASGSMDNSGYGDDDDESNTTTKWYSAMKTAIAIAQATSMVSNIHCVISVRGAVHTTDVGTSPLMWVVYDSKKASLSSIKEKLYTVAATGSTPEGLCFEAVQKDIELSARGKDSYFINLSDGCPGFSNKDVNYAGKSAYKHTQSQIEKMRSKNIKIVSYYITSNNERSENYIIQNFRTMYGKDAEFINTNSLSQLAKSINSMFERKQS
jgi:hypothetical protein